MGSSVNKFGEKSWVLVAFVAALFASVRIFVSVSKYTKKRDRFWGVRSCERGVPRRHNKGGVFLKKLRVFIAMAIASDFVFLMVYLNFLRNERPLLREAGSIYNIDFTARGKTVFLSQLDVLVIMTLSALFFALLLIILLMKVGGNVKLNSIGN
jgi:hypothetical protein